MDIIMDVFYVGIGRISDSMPPRFSSIRSHIWIMIIIYSIRLMACSYGSCFDFISHSFLSISIANEIKITKVACSSTPSHSYDANARQVSQKAHSP